MNYIISYPRSGNTAFRYLIELMTNLPTNGICGEINDKDVLQKPLLHKGDNYSAHKRHDFKGINEDDFVFFIIRNPLEAVIRHNEQPRGLALEKMKGYLDSWFDLLKQYDDFSGNKMLIYYDKLILVGKEESKKIYPDTQSNSNFTHRNKLTPHNLELLSEYVEKKHKYLNDKYLKDKI